MTNYEMQQYQAYLSAKSNYENMIMSLWRDYQARARVGYLL